MIAGANHFFQDKIDELTKISATYLDKRLAAEGQDVNSPSERFSGGRQVIRRAFWAFPGTGVPRMAQAETKIDPRDWGLLLFLSVLWAAPSVAGMAVKELPPLVIVLARVSIAVLALLPVHAIFQGPLPRDRRSWVSFGVMSVLNNIIPFTCIVSGQALIASGVASVINATTPLFAVAILALFREEAIIGRKLIGLLIGLAGVIVLRGAAIQFL